MTKKIIALSMAAAFATSSFGSGHADMAAQLEMLKKQIAALEAKLEANSKTIKKNTKKIKKTAKKANTAKALANNDNLKWDVDFRTSVDKINYKMADGSKKANDSLLTNRLWLNMAYAPSENVSFYGRLSYLKAYGAEPSNTQRASGSNTQVSDFDWLSNENAHGDHALNVKQAYWLYRNDTFFGTDVSWTASIGRRPSTDGLFSNMREDQARQSALSHTVNVEFDGASFRWNLDKVTPLEGSWIKLCMGRGITNATPRFTQDGTDYANSDKVSDDSNMLGFIFVPYDDGQYSVHTNFAKANNLIGYDSGLLPGPDGNPNTTADNDYTFYDHGDMSWMTAAFKADGIGEEISDRLDNTKFFVSWAQSKSDPNGKHGGMLGSTDQETGTSWWVGLQTPCFISEDGTIGIEWNKGSKYWRSMTYAEDTMIGSKIAARGTAWEIYYNKPLTKALSASVRYTKIDYDYTGSNGFFGSNSAPMSIADAVAAGRGSMVVEEASDLRAYLRYRF
jgi:hypothetical protein